MYAQSSKSKHYVFLYRLLKLGSPFNTLQQIAEYQVRFPELRYGKARPQRAPSESTTASLVHEQKAITK